MRKNIENLLTIRNKDNIIKLFPNGKHEKEVKKWANLNLI